jgi:hypothetical protein
VIPGLKPSYDVRAKVRVGIKKQTSRGTEFPAAVDYFVCDDPEFVQLCGEQPKAILVRFPFAAADDNFSTGMEWWRGKQLTCYSKGDEISGDLVAFRVEAEVRDEKVIGPKMGRDRLPILCRFRECPQFKTKDCKPTGRLQFFLDGGRTDAVLQVDTHSWNTIEGLSAVFANLGDPRGRLFELSVSFHQKGRDRFPVISLSEVKVNVDTDVDVGVADQLLKLAAALSTDDEGIIRFELAATLELTNPGWRRNEKFVARIKEVGVVQAAAGLLTKYQTDGAVAA